MLILLLSGSTLKVLSQTDSVIVSQKEYIKARQDLRDYRVLKTEHEKMKVENNRLKKENTELKTSLAIDEDKFKAMILTLNNERDQLKETVLYQQGFIQSQRDEIMKYRTRTYKLQKRVDNYNKGERLARFTIGTTIVMLGVVALVNEYMEDN
jgi:DNA gyrase/topoisomerase IV subunit A